MSAARAVVHPTACCRIAKENAAARMVAPVGMRETEQTGFTPVILG
jgi:hypothetical protein